MWTSKLPAFRAPYLKKFTFIFPTMCTIVYFYFVIPSCYNRYLVPNNYIFKFSILLQFTAFFLKTQNFLLHVKGLLSKVEEF